MTYYLRSSESRVSTSIAQEEKQYISNVESKFNMIGASLYKRLCLMDKLIKQEPLDGDIICNIVKDEINHSVVVGNLSNEQAGFIIELKENDTSIYFDIERKNNVMTIYKDKDDQYTEICCEQLDKPDITKRAIRNSIMHYGYNGDNVLMNLFDLNTKVNTIDFYFKTCNINIGIQDDQILIKHSPYPPLRLKCLKLTRYKDFKDIYCQIKNESMNIEFNKQNNIQNKSCNNKKKSSEIYNLKKKKIKKSIRNKFSSFKKMGCCMMNDTK